MKHYKVWVSIEEIDENKDHYVDMGDQGVLPDSLGVFGSLEKAMELVRHVVGAVNPLALLTSDCHA